MIEALQTQLVAAEASESANDSLRDELKQVKAQLQRCKQDLQRKVRLLSMVSYYVAPLFDEGSCVAGSTAQTSRRATRDKQ